MSDDYQVRKDIDRSKIFLENLENQLGIDLLNLSESFKSLLDENYYDQSELYTKDELYTKGELYTKAEILDVTYPVGAIYISVNEVNPANLFGGVWQKIEGKFLLGSSGDYPLTVEEEGVEKRNMGGEEEHTLTVEEMPSHNHTQNQHRHKQANKYSAGTEGSSNGYTYSSNRTITDAYTDYQAPYINPTGGGEAHNNMPPYLVVNVWERTE